MRYLLDKFVDVIAGFLGALILVVFLAWRATSLATGAAYASPSCQDPRGLERVPTTSVISHTAKGHNAGDAFDGIPSTLWEPMKVPSPDPDNKLVAFSEKSQDRVMTIKLDRERDIALVCVGNGLSRTASTYRNFGRIHDIAAWGADENDIERSALRNLDDATFQDLQAVAFKRGNTAVVHVRPDDSYYGQEVESYDPDVCHTEAEHRGVNRVEVRDEQGCLVGPTDRAGLSEIALYEETTSSFERFLRFFTG